ncbi:MAG: globin domain-containing protein [Acidimicrobiia bacterium]
MDVARLKESWNAVAAHGDQVPLYFYSTLFLSHPYTRELFPVSMAAQRDRLVRALGHIVSSVDNLDALVPYLQELGRDHRKFAVMREHYPAVGSALLETLEHFSGPLWNEQLATDWEEAYGLVAQVMIAAADEAAAHAPPWWEGEVVAVDRRGLDVAVLRVKPTYRLPYAAGQSLAVETPLRPRLWRFYSPATLPARDASFELHVRLVPGGTVSTALVQSTQKGDVLRLGAPVGHRLTLASAGQGDLVMLAGGTGVAPMKALLEQVREEGGQRRVHLFWGGRSHRDLYDLPALHAIAEENPWLRLVPCVSHEQSLGGQVQTGTAVDVALRYGSWPEEDIFICGSPEMVRGTLSVLGEAARTPPERLHVEEFGSEETLA